ncbi:MAG TPA: periplasmic heavy metal sensor [Thermoanaerobaculia bacterium]|nr:periplasmic heavy metal sensor [Thermoanaerobaculia bacterium]
MNRLAITLLVFLPFSAVAQPQPHPQDDPIGRFLFPPELIMAHSQDIGLQDKQRDIVKSEVQKAQSRFFDLQWQAKEETDKMVKLLQQSPLDETKILEQADRVMSLEREIKRTHLSLLIRLRNMLTPEQQGKLQQYR